MQRLTTRDLVACLEFLKRVYSARGVGEFSAELLSGIRSVVPAAQVSYNELDRARKRNQYVVDPPEGDPPGGAAVLNAFIHEHPLVHHDHEFGDTGPLKLSDFLTQSQYHRLGLYNEFFRQAYPRVEDLMNIHVLWRPQRVLAIALCRPRRSFSERDRFLANLLRAHLRQAYLNAETMELHGLVGQTLEAARQGVMVLDAELRPRVESGAVSELLVAYFGRRAENGRSLPEELSAWVKRELAALALHDDLPYPRTPLVVEQSGRRLLIRLIRQPEGQVLLLNEQPTRPDANLLERLGLTAKQGQVLSWLAQGKSDAEIATLVGSSRRTVEKHLEHIYAKLGVENRTAATSRALLFLSSFRY